MNSALKKDTKSYSASFIFRFVFAFSAGWVEKLMRYKIRPPVTGCQAIV